MNNQTNTAPTRLRCRGVSGPPPKPRVRARGRASPRAAAPVCRRKPITIESLTIEGNPLLYKESPYYERRARPDLGNGRPSLRLRTLAAHLTQTLPFSLEALEGCLDLEEHSYIELKPNTRVYALACAHIAAHGTVQSFRHSEIYARGRGGTQVP